MDTKQFIKKADIILTIALVAAGLLLSWFFSFHDTSGEELKITAEGKLFGTYSLYEDQSIDIVNGSHQNHVVIKDGSVRMSGASCSGQDCVHQHSISKSGETIVCLPNRVVLEITGGEKAYDAISQ